MGEIAAFSAWCVKNKKDSSDAKSLKEYQASLAPASGGSTGHRGRIANASVRIYGFDGEGNPLGSVECLDKMEPRMLAAATFMGAEPKLARLAFTRGFAAASKNPAIVRILTADGHLVEGYAVSSMTDALTGETENLDADSVEVESVEVESAAE